MKRKNLNTISLKKATIVKLNHIQTTQIQGGSKGCLKSYPIGECVTGTLASEQHEC